MIGCYLGEGKSEDYKQWVSRRVKELRRQGSSVERTRGSCSTHGLSDGAARLMPAPRKKKNRTRNIKSRPKGARAVAVSLDWRGGAVGVTVCNSSPKIPSRNEISSPRLA